MRAATRRQRRPPLAAWRGATHCVLPAAVRYGGLPRAVAGKQEPGGTIARDCRPAPVDRRGWSKRDRLAGQWLIQPLVGAGDVEQDGVFFVAVGAAAQVVGDQRAKCVDVAAAGD